MPLIAIAGTGVLCAAVAAALTPWARRLVHSESRWLRHPVPAAAAGLAGVGAATLADGWPELLAFAVLAVACGLLGPVDLATFRLPDRIVGPTYAALLGALLLAAAVEGEWDRLLRAVLAGLVVLVGYFVLAWISPTSLGLGDVKLSGLLGVFLGWLGWRAVLLGTLSAFVLFALLALALLAARRTSLGADLPFGPAMMLGAAAGAAWWALA